MHRNVRTLAALALSSTLFALPVQASTGDLPPAQRFGAVTVLNGGVDLDEAERLKQMAPQYPLRVVFSVRDGNYAVADAFTILRDGQPVAEVPSAGPWLLIDLPPGRYRLQADFEGQVTERALDVRAGTSRTMHWVAPPSVD